MSGIDLLGPREQKSAELDALRAALGAPPPWFSDKKLGNHLFQAMWYPTAFFTAQEHVNRKTGRPFSLLAYYADDPGTIAYCDTDGDNHLATIGAPFIWRLVKVCDRLSDALAVRPRAGPAKKERAKVARDPTFASLLAGDVPVTEAEAVDIVSRWPDVMKEDQQIELGPYALFHDLVRLIWMHEWAHALTGHVRFAARELQLTGLPEFSAERAQLQTTAPERPPANEVFQAIEMHADEFAVRYCVQQILWGYDPVGRVAGPTVDLIDRLLIFNTAFCVFAVMWWLSERRYTPDESFVPARGPESPAPDLLFRLFTTTHPPPALRYMRFRDFERDLATQAAATYGPTLSPLVDALSFNFLYETLTGFDGHFSVFVDTTPMAATTPAMKRLIAYEAHLLELDGFISPHLVELGYLPTKDPFAEDEE